jgi:Domain of unknown function (DUF3560)
MENHIMTTLTIEHTAAGGTVLLDTTKGDGAAEALRAAGGWWRWSRNIGRSGAWYLPHSRDRAPSLGLIDQTADALRAAGFAVEVHIDATPRPMEEAEAERSERMDARADRLSERAARRLAQAEARYEAGHQLADRIPFGQPILVGHHSEGRARADHQRIKGHFEASYDLRNQAAAAQARAETAEKHMRVRHDPVVVGRRIERLAAERRRIQRELDGYTRNFRNGKGVIVSTQEFPPATGQYRLRLDTQAIYLDEQLRYWRSVLDQAREAGQWAPVDREAIRPGDRIRCWAGWRTVVRVNKTTVSVESGYTSPYKIPLHEITGHQRTALACYGRTPRPPQDF